MSKSIARHITRRKEFMLQEVAIFANQETQLLEKTTLTLLKAYRIPANKISIFVNTSADALRQKEGLHPYSQGRILLKSQYTQAYPVGTLVVQCAENLRGFIEYSARDLGKKKPLRNLLKIFKKGFLECAKQSQIAWGIQNADDILRPTITRQAKQWSSALVGIIHSGVAGLPISQVVRLNFIKPL